MSRRSTRQSPPQPLTFTETALHYNEPGESFSIQCPTCGHAVVDVARGPKDGLKVQCDRGCPRKKIMTALSVAIRGEPTMPSQAQPVLPFPSGSHPPELSDLPGPARDPSPLAPGGTPDVAVAPGAAAADVDSPVGEIVLIGSASDSRSCQHQAIRWVRAPDNGDPILRCAHCSALKPCGNWLFWERRFGWHVRRNSASIKLRCDPSTGILRRVDMDEVERVPVCPQCRGTVEVDGQCLFCAHPRGYNFPDAA